MKEFYMLYQYLPRVTLLRKGGWTRTCFQLAVGPEPDTLTLDTASSVDLAQIKIGVLSICLVYERSNEVSSGLQHYR